MIPASASKPTRCEQRQANTGGTALKASVGDPVGVGPPQVCRGTESSDAFTGYARGEDAAGPAPDRVGEPVVPGEVEKRPEDVGNTGATVAEAGVRQTDRTRILFDLGERGIHCDVAPVIAATDTSRPRDCKRDPCVPPTPAARQRRRCVRRHGCMRRKATIVDGRERQQPSDRSVDQPPGDGLLDSRFVARREQRDDPRHAVRESDADHLGLGGVHPGNATAHWPR